MTTLANFSACCVLVLGDIMLDRYVLGEVRRISPEAPIPVLRGLRRHAVLGGAGNVAKNISALGARAILVGLIGDDQAGREVAEAVADDALITMRGVLAEGRPTTVKTRFMSGSHQLLRFDEEVTHPADVVATAGLIAAFAEALPQADVVVLSDYAKGVLRQKPTRMWTWMRWWPRARRVRTRRCNCTAAAPSRRRRKGSLWER